jgi:hypothetical protein
MGAGLFAELSKTESTGPDSNRRRRITGAESSPLDDQCLSVAEGPIADRDLNRRSIANRRRTIRGSGIGGARTLTRLGKNQGCCR